MREETKCFLFGEAACCTAEKQGALGARPPGQLGQHQERLCLSPLSRQTELCIPDSYPIEISDPDPPIKNLRMDPERKRLTWDLHGNVSEITCFINSKPFTKARKGTYCNISDLSCQVTNYSVTVTKGQPFSAWLQYPRQEGNPWAAAENLTCWVHDVDFVTCRWAVGRQAPRDVQYNLYLENLDSYEKWPCSQYRADEQGTNVQCRFHNISVLSKDQTRFLVNGTSSGSKIPCSETSDKLAKIVFFSPLEVLAAPQITSRWCNQSYSFMRWQVRSHLNDDFKYELQIQKGMELAYKQEIYKAFLELNNPGTYTVQVRARDATFSHYKPWGPWSVPQHFVCEEGARLPAWLTSLLIALGTLLSTGLALLFCRFLVTQKLFPPIPHMKDHINGKLQNGRTVRGGCSRGTHLGPGARSPAQGAGHCWPWRMARERDEQGRSQLRSCDTGGHRKVRVREPPAEMTWDPDQDSQEECPVVEVQVLGET
ncbi:interleukin-3 receptor subunit alpha isoform X3 [Kogia breviceps]|uniref:interleukin-3 receptor subunit alpha isoform X3 n=1 Tax=Kogia breviceps TaxID=27615 RepID=UPI0034D2F384